MVVAKKWQIASGVAAAMAIGTGAAVAQPDAEAMPVLEDVVGVSELTEIRPDIDDVDLTFSTVIKDQVVPDTPLALLAEMSAASEPTIEEPTVADESVVSQASVQSVSQPSVQSVSQPSVQSVSVPSAESDD